MEKKSIDILGLIPARGGSKSIPKKNIIPLYRIPLIEYVIRAAKQSKMISRIICSSDDDEICKVCLDLGIEVTKRSAHLAQDNTPILDVIIDLVYNLEKMEDYHPFAIALLQPTSPFLVPAHIDECTKLLVESEQAGSVQTITAIPHNYHAYNQRTVENGEVRFRFAEERKRCYNKQTKPKLYMFGNLVMTRTSCLLDQKEVFAQPSLAYEIPYHYSLDVDGPDDLDLAHYYLHSGKVKLDEGI